MVSKEYLHMIWYRFLKNSDIKLCYDFSGEYVHMAWVRVSQLGTCGLGMEFSRVLGCGQGVGYSGNYSYMVWIRVSGENPHMWFEHGFLREYLYMWSR